MPRILITCPTSHLPVSTGYRAPGVDPAAVEGERSFRCGCGSVHVWTAASAWIEDARSLDQEIAAEMTQLGRFMIGPEIGGQPLAPSAMEIRGRRARDARDWRDSLLGAW